MDPELWSLVVSILAVIISIFASVYSGNVSRSIAESEASLQRQLAESQASLQRQLAESQASLQRQLDEKETTLENRRFFTTALWDKMSSLDYIDPAEPITPDVRKVVNTLEAVAMCWQAGIVDKKMVVISFGRLFDELYNQIAQITTEVEGLKRTGYQLLTQNPAVPAVRQQIQEELNKQGEVS